VIEQYKKKWKGIPEGEDVKSPRRQVRQKLGEYNPF
jgi:hypothetical protein